VRQSSANTAPSKSNTPAWPVKSLADSPGKKATWSYWASVAIAEAIRVECGGRVSPGR
jgi:hypothetical protein